MGYTDVLIIGAGAAGLMCAIEAGKRGRRVLLLEHNESVGEKIRISGGGRCNFTNTDARPECYLSQNPHFSTSALARYTQSDFIAMVQRHHILFHERTHGQLFCDDRAEQLIQMLLEECRKVHVQICTGAHIDGVTKQETFQVTMNKEPLTASAVVVATGGISIPKMGATPFGYMIAKHFGINVTAVKPGLVPLVFATKSFETFRDLSGVSVVAEVSCNGISFRENVLFTHRGLSGPAILQISSYWREGDDISLNLLPGIDVQNVLRENHHSRKHLASLLEQFLPSRFIKSWLEENGGSRPLNQYSLPDFRILAAALTNWHLTPTGTEGYEKAEVTVGGIDTRELSSKTMEAKKVPGLYFVGEVVDVTGWLGGYNFQWAWSSGWAAGQVV